mmetsp:Transcript_50430/g.100338  ORF Transcript_50430/g.100338 Transcript_50430/m.100338 type:complete len:333 (+) Transcript_50430:149-1147(+)
MHHPKSPRMENSPEQAEYLIMLQPSEASPLAQILDSQREACIRAHGADETNLYPAHISLSGYFRATEAQAEGISRVLQRLVEERTPKSLCTTVRHTAATENDGYVILLVSAPGVKEIADELPTLPEAAGLHLRPKRLSHMSLAKGRSPEQQQQIMQLFERVQSGPAPMDLVFYRLMKRSDVQEFTHNGTPHQFQEVFRSPLQRVEAAEGEPPKEQLAGSASCTPKTSPRSVASTAVTTDSGKTSLASAAAPPDKSGLGSQPEASIPIEGDVEAPFFEQAASTGAVEQLCIQFERGPEGTGGAQRTCSHKARQGTKEVAARPPQTARPLWTRV